MKNNEINTCEVVRDLLPLVIDDVSSSSSRRLVDEHIVCCEQCRIFKAQLVGELDPSVVSVATDAIPESSDRKLYSLMKRLAKRMLFTALLIAAFVVSYVANIYGAWMGHPAEWWNFAITLVYIGAVSAFIMQTRDWSTFVKASRILSGASLITALYCTLCRLFSFGGFISAFLSALVSVPFYGFRWFADWTLTYILSAIVCAVWFMLSSCFSKRLSELTGVDPT